MQVAAETGVKAEEAIDSQRGQDERDRQTCRINGEEENSFEYRVLRARQQQDSSKDGTDARSPAEGKREADEERAKGTGATFYAVQPLIRIERVDLEQACEMEAEDDNDDPGKDCERPVILMGELSDAGGYCSQGDEDNTETENEAERVLHYGAQELAVRRLQGFHAGT